MTPALKRDHVKRCHKNAARNTCGICRRALDADLITSFKARALKATDQVTSADTAEKTIHRVRRYMDGAGAKLDATEKAAYDRKQIKQSNVPSITQCCSVPVCGSCVRAWTNTHELYTMRLVRNRGRRLDRLPRGMVCNVHGKTTSLIGPADVSAASETSVTMRAIRYLEFRGPDAAACAYMLRSAAVGTKA